MVINILVAFIFFFVVYGIVSMGFKNLANVRMFLKNEIFYRFLYSSWWNLLVEVGQKIGIFLRKNFAFNLVWSLDDKLATLFTLVKLVEEEFVYSNLMICYKIFLWTLSHLSYIMDYFIRFFEVFSSHLVLVVIKISVDYVN
jgi:hypothetical protein